MSTMNRIETKQFLASMDATVPGTSTDQRIKTASGPAADAGARKAAAMHAANAAECDRKADRHAAKMAAKAEKAARRAAA